VAGSSSSFQSFPHNNISRWYESTITTVRALAPAVNGIFFAALPFTAPDMVRIKPSRPDNQLGPPGLRGERRQSHPLTSKEKWLQCHMSFYKRHCKNQHIKSEAERSMPIAAVILSRKGGNK
jgi:hypothetical protein